MKQIPQFKIEKQKTNQEKKKETLGLAQEIIEKNEHFPFPGIDQAIYMNIKTSEDREMGYATPIDELITRFKNEGIKLSLGKTGNIYVLPFQSNDVMSDSILVSQLDGGGVLDARLKKLVTVERELEKKS